MARVALSSSEQLQNTSTPLLHVFETRKTRNGTRGERKRGGGERKGETGRGEEATQSFGSVGDMPDKAWSLGKTRDLIS